MNRFARWLPAVSMLLISLVSYLDRNTLALLAPTILRETGLSNQQYGYIISAFSIAYMIGNPVWGMALDRVGVRRGMLAAVSFWSLASAAHAWATGLWSFGAARAALGFGEGATFPAGLRTVTQTLPPSLRSRGIAVAYSGGSLGAVVTPLMVTPVALVFGWRGAFWFTGLVGGLWLVFWAWLSRRPDLRQAPERQQRAHAPGPRFDDPRLWAFVCAYGLCALPLAFVLYGAPLYLGQARGFTQKELGEVLWIPPLGWEVGYFTWGALADRTAGRREALWMGLAMAASLPLAAAPLLPSSALLLGALFFAMFVAAGFVILSMAYATRVYSADHAGLIAGAGAGSWSLVVACVMPVFGRLFDQHRYADAFLLAVVFPVIGYFGWWGLSRNRAAGEH